MLLRASPSIRTLQCGLGLTVSIWEWDPKDPSYVSPGKSLQGLCRAGWALFYHQIFTDSRWFLKFDLFSCEWDVWVRALQHARGSPRTTLWSQLSPSTFTWALGIEPRSSVLCASVVPVDPPHCFQEAIFKHSLFLFFERFLGVQDWYGFFQILYFSFNVPSK